MNWWYAQALEGHIASSILRRMKKRQLHALPYHRLSGVYPFASFVILSLGFRFEAKAFPPAKPVVVSSIKSKSVGIPTDAKCEKSVIACHGNHICSCNYDQQSDNGAVSMELYKEE